MHKICFFRDHNIDKWFLIFLSVVITYNTKEEGGMREWREEE